MKGAKLISDQNWGGDPIDFGDSEFHWFAYDIAIAVYHASQTIKDRAGRDRFASIFFNSFIEGYVMGNSVNDILEHVLKSYPILKKERRKK